MADKIKVLSDATIKAIKEMWEDYKRRPGNTTNRPAEFDDDFPAPEVYIARTPENGIPGLSTSGTTGTSEADAEDDVPGFADCDIYRIVQNGPDDYTMERMGNEARVYNLGTAAIDQAQFVPIARDKSGRWLVTSIAISASNPTELTVEEVDGDPSEENVSIIQIDQNTMRLEIPTPGTARIFSLANGIDVVDDHTGTTYANVTTLTFDSTPSAYNPALGDWVFELLDTGTGSGESGANLSIRLNGRTATMFPVFACIDGDFFHRDEEFRNGLWKTESALYNPNA